MMNPSAFDNIPSEMRALDRWVCYAKGDKVPMDAKVPKASGSSTNAATWATFEVASGRVKSNDYAGIGIILNGDGLVAVDIDHCIHENTIDPKALKLLEDMGATYVEISVSGSGLHAYGYSEPLEKGCKGTVYGLSVELYSSARFMIVTGNIVSKTKTLSHLKGFKKLALALRPENAVIDQEHGPAADHQIKQTELFRRVISGEVFHDSLRDLAASYVAAGMAPGAVVNTLRGLMEQSAEKNTQRWADRYDEIPKLVESATIKYAVNNFDKKLDVALTSEETRFKLLTSAELAELPPLKWLIQGVLPSEGLAAIYGPSGSGKSFLAMDMCAAIAEGRRWFGLRTTQAPVIYMALEGEGGIKVRVQAWESHNSKILTNEMRLVLQPFKISETSDLVDLIAAAKKFHTAG